MGACIPHGYGTSSFKAKAVQKGVFQLGTTGVGWIAVKPILENNTQALFGTTTVSVGGAATALNGFTNLRGGGLYSNLPFTLGQMTTAGSIVTGRTVAHGLRCRYAGNESTRSGIVATLEEPDHADANLILHGNIMLYDCARTARPPPDGSWHTVCWTGPRNDQEVDYISASVSSNMSIVIAITGNAGDNWEFESVIHNEYIGRQVVGTSPSPIDESGYSKVISAITTATSASPLEPSSWSSVLKGIVEESSHVIRTAKELYSFVAPLVNATDSVSPLLLGL
jgi:hypothetical protein